MSEFSRVIGYNANILKSILFLCTNNKQLENEIKKIISFIITPKRI